MNTPPRSLPCSQSESCCRNSLPRFVAFFLSFGVVFAGCSTVPENKPPAFHASGPSGNFEQTGNAVTPARADTGRADAVLAIPKGSTVETRPDGSSRVTVSRDTTANLVTVSGSWTGPTAEKAPSPVELARGKGVLYFYAAAVLCALAAVFMGWRQHYKAAALFAAAAVLMPIVANAVSSTAGIIVGAVFGAGGIALFAAWHFMKDRETKTL